MTTKCIISAILSHLYIFIYFYNFLIRKSRLLWIFDFENECKSENKNSKKNYGSAKYSGARES